MNYFVSFLLVVLYRFALVKSQIIKYYTKQLIFFLLIAITAAVGILALGVLMPFGMASRANVICGRTMAYLSILLNVKINIEGEEHLSSIRPCVFIMNHQSNMDLPVMGSLIPENTFILAKKEITYLPFIGQYFVLAKNIIIDRSDRKSAIETMQNLAKRMTLQKSALWMFPEGTRSYQSDKSLLDFKKGAFHLAVQGKFPIIMAVVSTYSPRYDEKVKVFRPLTVNVKILEPVYGTNVDQLIESTHARMTECLQTLNTTE